MRENQARVPSSRARPKKEPSRARPKKENAVEAFCRALWRGEQDTVARLAPILDPNGRDRFGYTPLGMAAQYGDLGLVKLLVGRGADVNQGRQFLTPVTFAARRGDRAMVAYLRKEGALVSLFTRTHLGQKELVRKELTRAPERADLRDEEGSPLLHHAVEAVRADIVSLLLDHGVSVGVTDANGETPLHRVSHARRGPAEEAAAVATLLLDRGADPNARNWDQVTPLHQAVRARNLPVVAVLLSRGADPNARDKSRGSTPLRRAVSATGAGGTAGTAALMVPLTRLLLKHGADPDMRDKRGVPVHASARDPAVKAVLDEHRREKRAPAPTATARSRPRVAKSKESASKRKR